MHISSCSILYSVANGSVTAKGIRRKYSILPLVGSKFKEILDHIIANYLWIGLARFNKIENQINEKHCTFKILLVPINVIYE
ncbi:hypothetical protein NQ317_001739 [Molorchus minor]|uniref:Uncharacterized protein n=1 Tax=Molorchus minor TaxID=1323400 RepID=A0ABQ9JWS9_9CUCU|nr:hypothetical protein NQ317_001739 [Molorchus minor]